MIVIGIDMFSLFGGKEENACPHLAKIYYFVFFILLFKIAFLSDFYRLYIYIDLYSYENYEFNFGAYMLSKLKENL